MISSVLHIINPVIAFLAIAVCVCFLLLKAWNKREPNSPPGTNGFPLIGVASIRKFPERFFEKLSKIYGPLYMVRFGWKNLVIISDQKIASEAFAKKDCFNDRPKTLPFFESTTGLFMVNRTDFQKEQRHFSMRTLRNFGMGKRSLEPRLIESSRDLCEEISALCGKNGTSKPFQIHTHICKCTASIISCMIFGSDICQYDQEFKEILRTFMDSDAFHLTSAILMLIPSLRFLPHFSSVWKEGIELKLHFEKAILKQVDDHRKSYNPNNLRDYIDCFLYEMNKSETGKNLDEAKIERHVQNDEVFWEQKHSRGCKPLASFHEKQLVSAVKDLFVAGMDTTSSTVNWIVLHLCKYQDVQKKLQREIDAVLGRSGLPSMSILEELPYVRAVIQEVARIRPVGPLAIPHLASRDAHLMGYRIPKGSILLTNTWAVHHNPELWPEPEKFLPERHLSSEGKFVKSTNFIPFGVGSRSCLGRQLADMELFLLTVTLFQRFHFDFPADFSPNMDGHSVVVLRPTKYPLIATER